MFKVNKSKTHNLNFRNDDVTMLATIVVTRRKYSFPKEVNSIYELETHEDYWSLSSSPLSLGLNNYAPKFMQKIEPKNYIMSLT